jgi:hypothetical protein
MCISQDRHRRWPAHTPLAGPSLLTLACATKLASPKLAKMLAGASHPVEISQASQRVNVGPNGLGRAYFSVLRGWSQRRTATLPGQAHL